MDIYDDIANEEFGMDYDQLGSNEKEWVRDEIDNMSIRESNDCEKVHPGMTHDECSSRSNDKRPNRPENDNRETLRSRKMD